jgi:hypothetical protein
MHRDPLPPVPATGDRRSNAFQTHFKGLDRWSVGAQLLAPITDQTTGFDALKNVQKQLAFLGHLDWIKFRIKFRIKCQIKS